jgi:hypothetical protein
MKKPELTPKNNRHKTKMATEKKLKSACSGHSKSSIKNAKKFLKKKPNEISKQLQF